MIEGRLRRDSIYRYEKHVKLEKARMSWTLAMTVNTKI
jgi:hypothetical protein